MDLNYSFWITAILAASFVGLGKGGIPVIASLAVPSLSLFMSPITAAGLLLPVYIVSDVFALFVYRRDYDPKVLKIAFFGMTLGVAIGTLTAHLIVEWILVLLIGLMGFIFAIRLMINQDTNQIARVKIINIPRGIFWTSISGFTSFISHNGGPPWQIFVLPLKLTKPVFVGTSVITFSYVNFIKLFPYIWLGQVNIQSTYVSIFLMLPASIAVYLGVKWIKVVSEKLFFNLVTWALLLISIKLIWDGIAGGFF